MRWSKFRPTSRLVEFSTGKIPTNELVDVGRSLVEKWVKILTNNGQKMASDVVV
jgi:hypothetical protein